MKKEKKKKKALGWLKRKRERLQRSSCIKKRATGAATLENRWTGKGREGKKGPQKKKGKGWTERGQRNRPKKGREREKKYPK